LTCCRKLFLGSSKLFPLPPKQALILARTVPANPNAITLQWDNCVYCTLDDNAKLYNRMLGNLWSCQCETIGFMLQHLIESHTRTKSSREIDLKHGLAVWHHESIWLPELTSSGIFGLLCAVMCCDMTLGTNKYYNISRATWPWYIQCGWWWMEATAAYRQFWVCIISTA
jgi:hypothetical protein